MIPQPRTSKKSKRSSKRLSAPLKTLNKDIKHVNTMETIQDEANQNNNNNNNNNNDLLDLFDFNNNSNNNQNGNTVNGNNNNTNNTDDFFDLFDDNPSANNHGYNNNQARNTINTLQIHPSLINPRESRSLQPDKLFDVAMWQNFGNNNSNDNKDNNNDNVSNPNAQKQNTQKNSRNTTLNFEPINIEKKDEEDEEEEDEEEEEEEADEVEVEPKKKIKTIEKRAPRKPRASAPPTTLSSSLKQQKLSKQPQQQQQQQQQQQEKETNALDELHRGAALLKYPRRSGFPHFKHIQLSQDNLRIEWFSKRKNLNQTCIYVKDIRDVVRGQETEVFKKFHQKTLEKSSFSVVYGPSYKTLDVAAKSIDECEMWVKCILKLCEIYKKNKKESDLSSTREIFVGINFKDRNRPMSRPGSGNFIRANSSKTLKIDPVALKEIERDMESLHKTYSKTVQLAQKEVIIKSNQYQNIQYVLSELEERIEELTYEVANIRDTELAKREVWRANVDLSAIQEKVEVLQKHLSSGKSGKNGSRRKSNFL